MVRVPRSCRARRSPPASLRLCAPQTCLPHPCMPSHRTLRLALPITPLAAQFVQWAPVQCSPRPPFLSSRRHTCTMHSSPVRCASCQSRENPSSTGAHHPWPAFPSHRYPCHPMKSRTGAAFPVHPWLDSAIPFRDVLCMTASPDLRTPFRAFVSAPQPPLLSSASPSNPVP
jgi:hypothetical protein